MFQKRFQFGDQTVLLCFFPQFCSTIVGPLGCCGPVALFWCVGGQGGVFHEIPLLFKNRSDSHASLETPVCWRKSTLRQWWEQKGSKSFPTKEAGSSAASYSTLNLCI